MMKKSSISLIIVLHNIQWCTQRSTYFSTSSLLSTCYNNICIRYFFGAEINSITSRFVFCEVNRTSISFYVWHFHFVWLNLCIEWRHVILLRYLQRFSLFGVNGLYHLSAIAHRVWKNLIKRKNVLVTSACISKAQDHSNASLKLSEAFVVIMQNGYPPSLVHQCFWSFKLVSIQVSASSHMSFSFVPLALYTSKSDVKRLSHNKLCKFSSLKIF